MRAFKYIVSIIVAMALIAGVVIYAMGELKQGAGAPNASGSPVSSSVIINEFMASNSSYLPDDKGNYSDWIEIYNPTDSAVSLSGLGLSDDKAQMAWGFPDISLAAGSFLVVFASGEDIKDQDGALHASFKLSASGGGVYLMSSSGQVLDAAEYQNQSGNISTGRDAQDMKWKTFDKPTPGFANDEAGFAAFTESRKAQGSPLLITEVMPSNKNTIADNTGAFNDYIEIYNAGSEAVSLAGYGLSDDPANVMAWRFPDVTLQPGAYFYVFASGLDLKGTDMDKGVIHTNFRISSYRETIVLSNPAGLLIDQVAVAEVGADKAYMRIADESGVYGSEWQVSSQPSPGFANTDEGHTQFAE